ncbi:initiation factor 2 [Lepidopterella palustris CBS 459.81]|uniref:Translation initiation factor IF-2, mitochondrial n=1 Tax=Lepidopterella palustris CBS 459.81 TaxID=1314670 RepID=A0A8E2ELA9_9PEZI|nr:initiation factor 2 [Lepidopterella palustris CBS 459.81]
MKESRILRASSTRYICIFCATRRCADGTILSIRRTTFAQRRHLNYSSNASQFAAAAVAYRQIDNEEPSGHSNGQREPARKWGASFGGSTKLSEEEAWRKEALRTESAPQTSPQARTLVGASTTPEEWPRDLLRARFGPPRPSQRQTKPLFAIGSFSQQPRSPTESSNTYDERPRDSFRAKYGAPQPPRRETDALSAIGSLSDQPERLTGNSTQSSWLQSRRRTAYMPQERERPRERPVLIRKTLTRADINAAPPPSDIPDFGPEVASNWAHLKRRTETNKQSNSFDQFPSPASASQPSSQHKVDLGGFLSRSGKTPAQPPPSPRHRLADDEIQQLLRGASRQNATGTGEDGRRNNRPFVPLARESNAPARCYKCGEEGHRPRDCPRQATIWRGTNSSEAKNHEPLREGRNDTLQASEPQRQPIEQDPVTEASISLREEERRRAADLALQRRLARFKMDEDKEQYMGGSRSVEEPKQRGKIDRRKERRGNRVMRSRDDEELDEELARAERKRQRKEEKRKEKLKNSEPTPIYLPEYISVANLASILKIRVEEFAKKMEQLGFEDVQNDHILNAEHAGLIAMEYNFEPIIESVEEDADLYPAPIPEDVSALPTRPPVVTIMGHVDHGKTTILDFLRKSSVAATEFGGITQHIGAFSVPLESGKIITFLDTPGHAAFLSMRQRGANVTDIVVLVVAADDSVKPQTIEAIKHAQSASVPIIVAINKIDKEEAAPDRVKQDLARHGVVVEDFGGDTQVVCVSGKTGKGMAELEEAIVTLSEILDHRADTQGPVEGWVLEGTTKKSGRVATVLVRRGTLRTGDVLVAGTTWGRVRTLKNEASVAIEEVGPGMPVEVDGWREQPLAGDEVLQAPDEQKASAVSELRHEKVERERMAKDMEAINEARRLEMERRQKDEAAAARTADGVEDADGIEEAKPTGPEIVSFIVKADVSGSVEAVVDSIAGLGNAEVGCTILRSGVGSPAEFDVEHAAAAMGHIINFNTPIPPNISALAEEKGVRIIDSNVIYRLSEDAKALLSEKLAPRIVSRVLGEAEIAQPFEIGLGGRKKVKIAGSKVRNGVVTRGGKVRVLRNEMEVYDGTISSLKQVKKDVAEMRKNSECGIGFEGWEGFEVGDQIQCYEEIKEKRYL